jgi:nitric oxide reductase large subunit
MKKILVASILGIVATVATVNQAKAQGFVFFGNYTQGGVFAPVTYTGAPSAWCSIGGSASDLEIPPLGSLLYLFRWSATCRPEGLGGPGETGRARAPGGGPGTEG